jgi:hypothetical protein
MSSHADESDSKEKEAQSSKDRKIKRFSPVEPVLRLRGQRSGTASLRGETKGLDPREAIQQWFKFAQAKGYTRVTGNRRFSTHLEKVETVIEEEHSLFEFCRHKRFSFAERLAALASGPITHEGVEHRVFYSLEGDPPLATKFTFPGKYGRIEHTPFLYVERLAIAAELFPILDLRIQDCMKADGQFSITTTMRAFVGPHPSLEEIDRFLWMFGFQKFSEVSTTVDYRNSSLGLIFRDCHSRNWIKIGKNLLVPVDICPEVDEQHA